MNGSLIACPYCEKQGKKQILGKLLETGEFLVLRFHHGTTLFMGKEYEIKCGCGWVLQVTNGTAVYNYV